MGDNLGNKAIPVWAIPSLLDKKDLQLPSFQRDAVWDEERVELLWDSLLRGIPIGNLIVAFANLPTRELAEGRYDPAKQSSNQEKGNRCVLMDGQQRAIGIQQGLADWRKDRTFRLWVDVDPVHGEQKRKEHTVTHPFFLCTRGFPWGAGVSDAQRRDLRGKLESTHPEQIKENGKVKPDYRLSLHYTRPAKAKLPIPFASIARWFIPKHRIEDSLEGKPWPEPKRLEEGDIRHRITELIEGHDTLVSDDIRDQWQSAQDKIEKWIREKQDVIRQALDRKIFFELAFGGNLPQPDDLGEAFNRINRLGMPLDGTDLFFSALKLHWSDAHDLVWRIYNDKDAGKLLAPPQIVHAAVRLAIADHNCGLEERDKIRDRPDLNLADARAILNEKSSIGSKIKQLISQGNLLDLFCRLRSLLQYRVSTSRSSVQTSGKDGDDFGLPLPMLARFGGRKVHIFHNLLLWLHRHPESADEKTRLRMVRYALVDQLFLKVNIDYRRKSFTEIEKASIDFPDARLIALAADLNLLIQAFKSDPGDSKLLANSDDFKTEVNGKEDPADFTDLLLWVQRHYLYDKFPDYDPTLFYNVGALPWDKDHIWPQAKMNGRSDVREDRDKCKWSHLSSIGNLCILDKRDNRGNHDLLPANKYVETMPKYLGISDSEFSDFCGLKLENDQVTTTFLKEFREVVEKRRAWLYQELYETLLLKDICRSPDPDGSLQSHT